MPQIQIGASLFEVYGDQATANAYFSAASHGAPWSAATGSLRNQALVTASRVFDRTNWQGKPTETIDTSVVPPAGGTQFLQWPRTGLVDRNGVVVPSATVPLDVVDGNFEYALELINTPATQTDDLRGSNLSGTKLSERVEGAITVASEQTFFIPTIGRFAQYPKIVQDLVGLWLAGTATIPLSFVSGADETSPLDGAGGDFGFVTPGLP